MGISSTVSLDRIRRCRCANTDPGLSCFCAPPRLHDTPPALALTGQGEHRGGGRGGRGGQGVVGDSARSRGVCPLTMSLPLTLVSSGGGHVNANGGGSLVSFWTFPVDRRFGVHQQAPLVLAGIRKFRARNGALLLLMSEARAGPCPGLVSPGLVSPGLVWHGVLEWDGVAETAAAAGSGC